MSADRELLELAAKAAEMGDAVYHGPIEGMWSESLDDYWNPLTDDGDALRLAVKLRMEVDVRDDLCWSRTTNVIECAHVSPGQDGYEQDIGAATRRAIVRAAAEIGRQKP
jgi:hypothetical protein